MKFSKPGEHQAWFKRSRGSALARAAMVRSKRRRGKLTAEVEALRRLRFVTPAHSKAIAAGSQQEVSPEQEAASRESMSCVLAENNSEMRKLKLRRDAKDGMGGFFSTLAVAALLMTFGGLIDLGELLGCLIGAGLACWMIWNDVLHGEFPPVFAAAMWLSIAIAVFVFVPFLRDLFMHRYFLVSLAGGFGTLYVGTRALVFDWPDHAPQKLERVKRRWRGQQS